MGPFRNDILYVFWFDSPKTTVGFSENPERERSEKRNQKRIFSIFEEGYFNKITKKMESSLVILVGRLHQIT